MQQSIIALATKKEKQQNLETSLGIKITVWIFQATNFWNCTQKDLNMVKKGKPQERKRISSNGCTKQRHESEFYVSENW